MYIKIVKIVCRGFPEFIQIQLMKICIEILHSSCINLKIILSCFV